MSAILSTVRHAVRRVIQETPELRQRPDLERQIARKMVGVSLAAAQLLAEEKRLTDRIAARSRRNLPQAQSLSTTTRPPLAQAQTASDIHGQSAVNNAANVLRATRDAIDFPGFVTSLITGVFQSIQTSSITQLQAFSDLLGAVNATTSDFATTQITSGRAATWAASHFNAFTVEGDGDNTRLVLRSGSEMPAAAELARILEASPTEVRTVEESDLTETLLPLVRRKLARDRQSMLSTMVLMGLQRVVVDDGHIHASMDLRVDARSTAEQNVASQTDTRVETEASGSFGMGAWGASARLAASVGYVHSDQQHTREDIAVSAGIRSSVDVRFHTETMDNNRIANNRTLDQIRSQAMVPETERAAGSLIAQAPPRATNQVNLPAPRGPMLTAGSTTDAARRAREEHSGANVENPPSSSAPAPAADPAPAPAADPAPAPAADPAPAAEANPNPTVGNPLGDTFDVDPHSSSSIGGRNRVPASETSGRPRATFRAER